MPLGAISIGLRLRAGAAHTRPNRDTIHLHATGTAPEAAAEWLIDLAGEDIAWRRGHEKAAVAERVNSGRAGDGRALISAT